MPPTNQPNTRSLLLFGVAALLVIATVPYFVPMQPVVSDSYIFGYNNRAGAVLFLLFAAVGAYWARPRKPPTADALPKPMPRYLMWGGIGIVLTMCFGMYELVGRLDGFAEGTYFIQRLHLLAAGRVPYREFEFAYGVALLYGPWWIARLLHIGLTSAYFLFWTLCVGFGVFAMFESIRIAGDERQDRSGLFVLLFWLTSFGILTTGPNYMALRFVLPIYFAVLIYCARHRETVRWRSSALTVVATCALLLLSPEMAVAFAVGSVIYFGINSLPVNKREVVCLGALVCALVVVFVGANALGVLATMRAFSAGGNNFPIYVAPSIAIFFAAALYGFRYFVQGIQRSSREDVFLYWIAIAAVLIPAALGRCDLGHILMYELGTFLSVALLLSSSGRARLWIRIGGAAYILLIIVPTLRVEYVPLTATAAAHADSGFLHRYAVLALGEDRVKMIRQDTITPNFGGSDETFLAPFSYLPNGSGAYDSPRIEYGYYYGLTNVLTPAQIQIKLNELRSHPQTTLLLPRMWVSYCVRTQDNSRALLSGLFGLPYIKEPEHEMDLYMPLCDYMLANYHNVKPPPDWNLGEYDLWAPGAAKKPMR
jgi:hypothetical protein